jgi:hypothetical protein
MADTNKQIMASFMQEQRARSYSETIAKRSTSPTPQPSRADQTQEEESGLQQRSQSTPSLGGSSSGGGGSSSSQIVPRLNLREQRNTISFSNSSSSLQPLSLLKQQQSPPQSPPQQHSPRKARHTISVNSTSVANTEEVATSSTEAMKSPRSLSMGSNGWPTSLRSPRANDSDSSGAGGSRSPPLQQPSPPLQRQAVVIGAPQLQRKDSELVIADHSSSSVVPLETTATTTTVTLEDESKRVQAQHFRADQAQPPSRNGTPQRGHHGLYRDFDVTQSHASDSSGEEQQKPVSNRHESAVDQEEDETERSKEKKLMVMMLESIKGLKNLKHNYYEDNELQQQLEQQQDLLDGVTQRLMELEQRTSGYHCCCTLL